VAHVSATRSYQPVRGVVAGIQLSHTHWVLVAPRVPEKAYRALWFCSCLNCCAGLTLFPPLPTGAWPTVLLWLINSFCVVNFTVNWSIVVPTINNCFFLGLGDFFPTYIYQACKYCIVWKKLILSWALSQCSLI